jgi:hypothetical protein
VVETTRGAVADARQAPEVRIFEAVPGALLEGDARPGTEVVASLRLMAPTTHRRWVGSWSTTAGATGRFALRLPYSTAALNEDPLTVKVRGPYKVVVGGRESTFEVSEETVQRGGVISLPPSAKAQNGRTFERTL